MTKYVDRWPSSINVEGGFIANPTEEQCREAGYELRTPEMREAERLAAEEQARLAPYEVSKIKLLMAFDELGLLDLLVGFIDEDPKRRLFWDAATTLDSDNPMILAAMAGIEDIVPSLTPEAAEAILRGARV